MRCPLLVAVPLKLSHRGSFYYQNARPMLQAVISDLTIRGYFQRGRRTLAKKRASKRTAAKTATKSSAKAGTMSDAIRSILTTNPSATVGEIRTKLDEQGVKASTALINKIKYGRKPGVPKAAHSASSNGRGSKANAIRDMWSKLGVDARVRDVKAALSKRGVEVTAAQISTLRKSLANAMHRNGSRRKATSSSTQSVSLAHLMAAKALAVSLGGVEVARHALESLASLIDE